MQDQHQRQEQSEPRRDGRDGRAPRRRRAIATSHPTVAGRRGRRRRSSRPGRSRLAPTGQRVAGRRVRGTAGVASPRPASRRAGRRGAARSYAPFGSAGRAGGGDERSCSIARSMATGSGSATTPQSSSWRISRASPGGSTARIWRVLAQVVEQLARDELAHAGLGPQHHERSVGIGHRPQRLAARNESGKAHDRRHGGAPEKGVGHRTTRRLDVTVERDLELVDERRTASQEPLEGLQEQRGARSADTASPSRRCETGLAVARVAPETVSLRSWPLVITTILLPAPYRRAYAARRGRTEEHEAVGGPHDPAFESGAEPAMQPGQRLGHRVAGPWIAELRDPWHAGQTADHAGDEMGGHR